MHGNKNGLLDLHAICMKLQKLSKYGFNHLPIRLDRFNIKTTLFSHTTSDHLVPIGPNFLFAVLNYSDPGGSDRTSNCWHILFRFFYQKDLFRFSFTIVSLLLVG